MPYGLAGRIPNVDPTSGSLDIEEPPSELYCTYMGGSARGLSCVFENNPAGADPCGPENTPAFALAGVAGAPPAGRSRATVVAKSRVTGVAKAGWDLVKGNPTAETVDALELGRLRPELAL